MDKTKTLTTGEFKIENIIIDHCTEQINIDFDTLKPQLEPFRKTNVIEGKKKKEEKKENIDDEEEKTTVKRAKMLTSTVK